MCVNESVIMSMIMSVTVSVNVNAFRGRIIVYIYI